MSVHCVCLCTIGRSFDVHLRSGGRFFAPKFQSKASWTLDSENKLFIDWGKYGGAARPAKPNGGAHPAPLLTPPPRRRGAGKYELLVNPADKSAAGSAQGKPESWRKMAFKRPFHPAEIALMDSEWEFIHPSGQFKVEFRADGFNHFVCNDFPAHSHWRFEGDSPTPVVYINFGKYGEYLVTLSADGETFEGSAKGDTSNWRKGKRLGKCDTTAVHEHDH